MPSVEQITFRLGRVSAGRFSPEGRVVFSAAWDGRPSELFARAPGSPEAQSLGLRDASLFGVSANGELAVSLHPSWSPEAWERGTLAVVSGAGGAPREVAERHHVRRLVADERPRSGAADWRKAATRISARDAALRDGWPHQSATSLTERGRGGLLAPSALGRRRTGARGPARSRAHALYAVDQGARVGTRLDSERRGGLVQHPQHDLGQSALWGAEARVSGRVRALAAGHLSKRARADQCS